MTSTTRQATPDRIFDAGRVHVGRFDRPFRTVNLQDAPAANLLARLRGGPLGAIELVAAFEFSAIDAHVQSPLKLVGVWFVVCRLWAMGRGFWSLVLGLEVQIVPSGSAFLFHQEPRSKNPSRPTSPVPRPLALRYCLRSVVHQCAANGHVDGRGAGGHRRFVHRLRIRARLRL